MRMSISLRFFVALFTTVVLAATGPAAHANPKYAALVIHEETGDVLFSKYPNSKRYPASLTKMMTLYMLFEAIDAGELEMSDRLYVSKRASQQPASRLGLSKGSYITVEKAIEALVIRSANDVATVVAEKLGGTESQFARKMTTRARGLGMRQTTFRNASGLPDRRQLTTAKDMALLSQRISQDFPQHFHYFSQAKFKWNGKTYSTHNKLVLNYDGADGLKTGYTRASGYNLATTAEQNGHRLIGVVMGGRSARTRDAHMKKILTDAFGAIRRKPSRIKVVHKVRPVPSLKPTLSPAVPVPTKSPAKTLTELTAEAIGVPVPTPKTLAMALPEPRPAITATAPTEAAKETEKTLEPAPKPQSQAAAPSPALDVASLATTLAALETGPGTEGPIPVGEGDAEPVITREFSIQVGAYREETQALSRIRDTESTVRSVALIPGREIRITSNGDNTLFRARFTRLTEQEALAACQAIQAQKSDCLVINAQ